MSGSSHSPGREQQTRAQVTGPLQAADLIDRLRAAGVTLSVRVVEVSQTDAGKMLWW